MNKTQKEAWCILGTAVLLIALAILFTQMLAAGTFSITLVRFWSLLCLLFMIASVVFLRRKQSPGEPDSDERDNTIKKNAILACFISVWISLVVVGIIPAYVVGDEGSIQVCLLPIINTGILIVSMLVYSVAILVQYGWRGKGEKL